MPGLAARSDDAAHWRELLDGGPRTLMLPTDRPRRPGESGSSGQVADRGVWMLPDWVEADAIPASIVTLAGFVALLARYSNEEEIDLGVALDGLHELPLRVTLGDSPTFRQVVTTVRGAVHRARQAAGVTREALRSTAVGWSPDQGWPYRVAFRYTPAPGTADVNGVSRNEHDSPSTDHAGRHPARDLALTTAISDRADESDELLLTLEYDAAQFDEPTARRMLGHLRTLLVAALAQPDQPLSALPLLTGAERQQMLVEWNATEVRYPDRLGLHQHVEAQAARTPDAVALTFGEERLTYAELNVQANRLAHYLRELGVGPEVLVGICMPRSIEAIVGVLAILKAGGAYLPLDPTYPEARLGLMMEDAAVPLVLTADALPAGLRPTAQVVSLTAERETIARRPSGNLQVDVSPQQLAYVIYTSGSTGRPKGVEITHAAVLNTLLWLQDTFVLTADDVVAQKTALSFTDSVQEIFWTLIAGARLAVLSDVAARDPNLLRQRLREERVTYTQFVPAQMTAFLAAAEAAGDHDLPRLRWIFNGGEALPLHLAQAWYGVFPEATIANIYGMTESAIYATSYIVENSPDLAERGILVGKPIANARVFVLNESGQPCPINVVGELYIGGVGIARGYRSQPELTRERFVPDPFDDDPDAKLYKTGDCVCFRADGSLEYVGRQDHQVKIRGIRVELGEIEAGLARHPAVRQAVVMLRRDAVATTGQNDPSDARLVAYVVPRAQPWPTVSELRQHLQGFLPAYMTPSAFVPLDRLPLTPSGKVDRRALPAPGTDYRGSEGAVVAPRTVCERRLVAIWERLLGVRHIGVTDDFFDLGGHSLLVARLFAEISVEFGVQLPLASVFPEATVEHLASLLDVDRPAPIAGAIVPIHPGGTAPPLFLVHGIGGGVLDFTRLARQLGPDQPVYGLDVPERDEMTASTATIEAMAGRLVRALREFRPTGPYLLGGHCFGGMLAYEMAWQLVDDGQDVELLALIDADSPSYRQVRVTSRVLKLFVRNLPFWLADLLGLGLDRMWRRARRKTRGLARRLAGQIRRAGADLPRLELEDLLDLVPDVSDERRHLMKLQFQALEHYRPKPYPGQITLFRARRQPLWCSFDADLGWGQTAVGPVVTHILPGNHDQMMTEERHIRALASELRRCLQEKAQSRSHPGAPLARPTEVLARRSPSRYPLHQDGARETATPINGQHASFERRQSTRSDQTDLAG